MTLDEVGAYVAGQGIGLTLGTNLFLGLMPPSTAEGGTAPDAAVALHEYGGRFAPEVRAFGDAQVTREYVRLQVEVRGTPEDYAGPRAVAQTLYLAMTRIMSAVLTSAANPGGVNYYVTNALQPPFPLDLDALKRYRFAFNCELFKQVTAA